MSGKDEIETAAMLGGKLGKTDPPYRGGKEVAQLKRGEELH